jgi:ribosomal protein L3 glutamine methyltransferase
MQNSLSENPDRNITYNIFLESCQAKTATVNDIIHLGFTLMTKEKVYHHYFGDHSLFTTAEYLTYHALKNSFKKLSDKISSTEALEIIKLFERRISERIPVAYITNETYFCGYKFYVNENVLVPRSIMISRFHDFLGQIKWDNNQVLDLCTGSGCIGITLALLNKDIMIDLVDISAAALEVAQINISNYDLNQRVKCIQSDLFSNVQKKYDLIITNPPYVSTSDYLNSEAEFKSEPKLALEAGEDGLDIINRILSQAKQHLNAKGLLIAEVGIPAAKVLKKKYPSIKFKWLKCRNFDGKEKFFSGHCIFLCKQNDLT